MFQLKVFFAYAFYSGGKTIQRVWMCNLTIETNYWSEKKKNHKNQNKLTSAQHMETMSSTVSMATCAVGHVNKKRGLKERPHWNK